MLVKAKKDRTQVEFLCLEEFIPAEHLLRKIDSAVDFCHIYDFVEDLYCKDNGRPSIDPVVLIKMVLIQHLYGISSLRKLVEEVQMNCAYRWFLGYLMTEQIPHFTTISYAFKHRFNENTIACIFNWILNEINDMGYLDPEVVFVDGTHIKANANIKKVVKKSIPVAAKHYEKQLMDEINKDREEHKKKPFDDTKPPKIEEKIINESTTDPESGVFHKGEHKKCLAYEAHTACDKKGYIVDVHVTAGNVHDSVAFDDLYDKLKENHPEIQTIVADSAYNTPYIAKRLIDDGKDLLVPYRRPMTKQGFFKKYDFSYDEYFDCVVCPNNKVLHYSTTNREGYKEFKSNPNDCKICGFRYKCTESKEFQKQYTVHVWHEYLEQVSDIRYAIKYKDLYAQRKETIERVFADAKEKYAMRYTPYRGLAQVTNWVRLKFACMNLKKLAIHKWRVNSPFCILCTFFKFSTIYSKARLWLRQNRAFSSD
ncbi:IS1182 family transposase [Paludicola sp. MB14-C6]|nr:IS1182 family transposase [Paludicola sp. MB14-C6]WMJ21806.1 IS1182 family transposase [Paludicola sp. MB14-C6]WMJ21879.1 IS1182 family transposase [Paludicola sp. MB14-C6]WMJ22716.1 IS1182 family transposase [Paludicola sp. MB14-C6]WMJ22996.1 IS1182 family transposase [Paludicola sp. MB14-C6]WMJ24263.1 IS1182 family transposase [Paludicola sp. MB14-C6]